MLRINKIIWGTAMIAVSWAVRAPAETPSLEINYDVSTIEIHAKAAGFFPATFRFEDFEAALSFTPDGQDLTEASFAFRYDEISSGSASKDRKVRNWLEAEMYPQGSFTVESMENEGGQQFAIGQLHLHGKSHPARFRYDISTDGTEITFSATAIIDYRDWDLPDLWVLAFKIKHELEILIEIKGTLPMPTATRK